MPAVSLEQFRKKIEGGKPVKGVLLLGEDAYLREQLRALLVDTFVPEAARPWGVSRLSAAAGLDAILQQAQSLPMLAPRQVIFVEETEAWEQLSDDSREQMVEKLEAYFDDPAPFSVLVFEAEHLDQRMRLAKLLAEHVLVVAVTVGEESEVPLAMQMAQRLDIELESAAAEALVDLLNHDMGRLHTEMVKLATYVGSRRRITLADVNALVISSKKYDVWQLADILALRKRDRALVFLDSLLREGEQPPALVGAMAWMYRKLIEAQDLPPGTPGWQAARQLGMRAGTAEQALRQCRKIPREQLLNGLAVLYEADSRLKLGNADERAVMEFLVTRLTA